jgi:competence protein ComEC
LGAIVFTTPLSAYYFGTVSLIAPLSNLLALWAVSAAFMSGLIAALIGLVLPAAGVVPAFVAALPARYLLGLIPALGRIPFAAVTLSSVYYAFWLLFVYATACLYLLWRGEKRRPVFPACACAVVLCAAIFFTNVTFTTSSLVVSVLDVGQGQSIVLHSGKNIALVDCGGNGYDNAGDVAADYLQNLGRTSLDLLVLTHYHADHANGVAQLMDRLDVKAVALPDVEPDDELRLQIEALAKQEGAQIRYVTDTDELTLGEATLTLYAPLGDEDSNELGLSVLGTAGDFNILITGDMSSDIEARLVKYDNLPDIELLAAGHHGSKYATSEKLLNAVTPELAVISVGDNTYGHPADETLKRLVEDGIAVYRTDLNGTVTVTVP